MEENHQETTKLMIGFAIALGSLLTAAVGMLIGFYSAGKNTNVSIIGWSICFLGLLEALFVKKIIALLFSSREIKSRPEDQAE